jgi:hypothetical protein
MTDVIVKRGLGIAQHAPLVDNFMDFIWQMLDAPPGNPHYLAVNNRGAVDSQFLVQFSPVPVNEVQIIYRGQMYTFNYPTNDPRMAPLAAYPYAQNCYIRSFMILNELTTDMLWITQGLDPNRGQNYIFYKYIVCLHQVRNIILQRGITPRERDFMNRYWDNFVAVGFRHAIEVGGYDIKWHRDSTVYQFGQGTQEGEIFGTGRKAGFITCGLYVNRPQGLPGNVAGISFLQGHKQHTIFPQGGTCVTFLDPSVMHRVVAATSAGTAPTKRVTDTSAGFVQRSAIFCEFFTTRERIETQMVEHPIMTKPSVPAKFRNVKKVYEQLNHYFRGASAQFGVPLNQMRNRIANAPNAHINNLYAYQHPQYALYLQQFFPGQAIQPPANFFVYKIKGESQNRRQKLLNLHNLYTNLAPSFIVQRVNQPNYISYYNNAGA